MFDYVVIGSGLAGTVIAERLASVLHKKVLIIEKRNHIGGNIFDSYDENGILIHNYGPHIFHTKLQEVWTYLSKFTSWVEYEHHVLGVIDGRKAPIPFNLNSLYELFPYNLARRLECKLIKNFGFNKKISILRLKEVKDQDLKFLADYIYEKVFLNYTLKQWGKKPEELDSYITGRVPIYISRDNRYFQDSYQGIPEEGYTKMMERMLQNNKIKVLLNTDYKEVLEFNYDTGEVNLFGGRFTGEIIYTGPIDYFFDYKFGQLSYRSLRFEFQNYRLTNYQDVGTVNYPNNYDFTRITEFKYLTGQKLDTTTIVREFPEEYYPDINIPYYPVKDDINLTLYKRYKKEVEKYKKLHLLGRLAEYNYYDMDAVVAKALKIFKERFN